MIESCLPLFLVPPGKEATLVSIKGGKGFRARLMDMGLIEGIRLKVLHSQGGGPCVVLFDNTRLVLGHGMAKKILVQEIQDA